MDSYTRLTTETERYIFKILYKDHTHVEFKRRDTFQR